MKQYIISILAVAALATASSALADGRGWAGEHDIRHFDNHHLKVWRGGSWHQERHDGIFGWWWVAAGMWYFYPQPVYPYPDPYAPPVVVQPVVVVQPAPAPTPPQPPAPVVQAQNWYYCEASKGYYPYVPSCPAGWKMVSPTPPGNPVK